MANRRINLADIDVAPAGQPPVLVGATDPEPAAGRAGPVPLSAVAANPVNVRDPIDPDAPEIVELAASMARLGQLQPCVVVHAPAFLTIFPEHRDAVGPATYVQVTGGRRRAALATAGLTTIQVVIRDDLAGDRGQFVAATAAENLDRQDLHPLEEARAVQRLVAECGTGRAAALRVGRTPAWVTQRLNLLSLADEVQQALRDREIPLREVRTLHELSHAEQVRALRSWRRRALTAVNAATPASRPRLTGVAAAIRRLGDTPATIAASLRAELSWAEREALAAELLREG